MNQVIPIAYNVIGGARIEHARPRDLGSYWVVRRLGMCLDKEGRWENEPPPGKRGEDFLKRFRYASPEDAYSAWRCSGEEPKAMMGEAAPSEGPMPFAIVASYLLSGAVYVERTTRYGQDIERWAVRLNGKCLNKDHAWETEPAARSRTTDFAERCRWHTAEEAFGAWRATTPA